MPTGLNKNNEWVISESVTKLQTHETPHIHGDIPMLRDSAQNKDFAKHILNMAIQEIMELGYHIVVPCGEPSPRTGTPVTSLRQVELVPVPDEMKRRQDNKQTEFDKRVQENGIIEPE